ncbi:uncharacterized protein LAJ45_03413 [Morchella importuna]|uniref:uncharacterized protein n=1 Tax=Morchella importuna TaxID=1174673 RepID=UPI001E8D6262|nr:uncharacterized protein LAJ45_03413 [Morchella importuna]KAH8152572.1 hypothetical protein LAJ45_03413 [Morchella importuna]
MDPPSKRTKLDSDDLPDAPDDPAGTTVIAASRTKQTLSASDEDVQQRRTLFIRSLPYSATSEALSTKFSFIAPLKHATVVADPLTKQSRGFGFVTFTTAEDARRAVKELHNTLFDGRKMSVEIAEPRHRDEAGKQASKEKKEKKEAEEVKRRAPRLIVRNLPWSVKDPQQLVKVFQSYGKVRNVIIPRKSNKPGAEMCGFAFVTMKGYKNAEKAMEKTNGMEIDGRTVAVDWAVEKDEWEKTKQADDTPEKKTKEETKDEAKDDSEEEEEDDNGGVGVLEGEDAEDMDDASDASDDEGSDLHMSDDEGSDDEEGEDSKPKLKHDPNDNSQVIFIRNLPFTTDDESLHAHFTEQFGPVRYARIVMDRETERPRGTGFVCFYNLEHFEACIASAPRPNFATGANRSATLLQDESDDPTGKYTIDGRVLQVTRAVNKNEASKLQDASAQKRDKAAGDKRRLFLLQEGTIPASSPAFKTLSNTERQLREASLKQRKALLQSNPMLNLSLTRLSVRNLPRSITAKELKALAREAAVGFVNDTKEGKRQPLSKEELARGGKDDKETELRRKKQGKGIVKQAKIIEEKAGSGRSRGYGFIEYSSHRWALMGLRWLNGHAVLGTGNATVEKGKKQEPVSGEDKKKRLIVEFAIENAQVVQRRNEKEQKARERSKLVAEGKAKPLESTKEKKAKFAAEAKKKVDSAKKYEGIKRKREDEKSGRNAKKPKKDGDAETAPSKGDKKDWEAKKDEKKAKAARIIARKRQIRRAKRG